MTYPALGSCNPEPIRSEDGRYRFQLSRCNIRSSAGERRGTVNFILLNPSDSTADRSDPTVHNCELMARQWGFENLVVTNLFAFVTSRPAELKRQDDPIGRNNDDHLIQVGERADLRVAAWGTDGLYRDRAFWLRAEMHLKDLGLKMLRQNRDYSPFHPSPQAFARVEQCVSDFSFSALATYDITSPSLRQLLRSLRP